MNNQRRLVLPTLVILVLVATLILPGCNCDGDGPIWADHGPGWTSTIPTSPPSATDEPEYGGTFTAAQAADTAAFDASTQFDLLGWQISLSNEALIVDDWAKGPAGTGETDMTTAHLGQTNLLGGWLAESWKM